RHQAAPRAEAQPQAGSTVLPVIDVPIAHIQANPYQPRQTWDSGALKELADSIREHGLLQPLVVTRIVPPPVEVRAGRKAEPVPMYQLIAGERRLRAAKEAGLTTVPVVVKEAGEEQKLELALVENIQRAELNPLEEAGAYKVLMDSFNLTQEEVARRVGKARSTIGNAVRLLNNSPEILQSLSSREITEGHARALLAIQDRAARNAALNYVIENNLNVRLTEDLAREINELGISALDEEGKLRGIETRKRERSAPSGERRAPLVHNTEDIALTDRFRSALGTRVQFNRSRNGSGRLVIFFDNEEVLQGIYTRIVEEEEF
ncbi:MAG: hypothetical protein DLM69_10630, partial [Candidatus Chloroheliales bacterium]